MAILKSCLSKGKVLMAAKAPISNITENWITHFHGCVSRGEQPFAPTLIAFFYKKIDFFRENFSLIIYKK